MDGHDMPYLMASYTPKGSRIPAVDPGGQIASGVMVASNDRRITSDQLRSLGTLTVPQTSKVPVPMSATAYGGSTPSARYNAAPVPAPAPTQAFGTMGAPQGFGEMRGVSGPARRTKAARDPELARRLWDVSVAMTGVDPGLAPS